MQSKSQQIYHVLKNRIEESFYPGGSRLPKEIELAEELRVSRKTLRLALDQLARQNLIERIKRKGTFVRTDHKAKYKILLILNEEREIYNPYPYIMPGIQTAAEAMNIQVESCTEESLGTLSARDMVRNIRMNKPDGIICLRNNFRGDEALLKILQKTGIPVLLPHAAISDHAVTGFAVLCMDFPRIMKDGLEYLKGQGHQKIATLSWAESGRGITREEYLRWQQEIGVDSNPVYYHTAASFDAIPDAMEQLLALPHPPTAVFCYSDFFAIRIYQYLKSRNIRIPEQLSVLSIGGHIGCNYLSPTLSAIDFDLLGIGQLAVRTIMEIVCSRKTCRKMPLIFCPHHIIERQSTNLGTHSIKIGKRRQIP